MQHKRYGAVTTVHRGAMGDRPLVGSGGMVIGRVVVVDRLTSMKNFASSLAAWWSGKVDICLL